MNTMELRFGRLNLVSVGAYPVKYGTVFIVKFGNRHEWVFVVRRGRGGVR